MEESHYSKSFIYFSVISITCLATLMNIEVQRAILPKFISASYMDNLSVQFNSILLKSFYNIMGTFFDKPSVTTLLVGDLPIYDNRKKKNKWNKYSYDSEQALIKNTININNYTKIPMSNNNDYHLFPNHNKTKMNVISFSLEEKKEDDSNEDINICFTKLSTISLFEIPIDNFIINFQDEYNLQSAFFKLKWKLNIPGIIIKFIFSNDYEYLCLVYKMVFNGIEIKYKLIYIKINNDETENLEYDVIDIPGNTKIMALAITKNLIVYSRKVDKYYFNFLYKNESSNSSDWISFSKNKIKFKEKNQKIINDLKFIKPNNNSYNNDILLFVKGIYSDSLGIKMFMKIINIDLNEIINIQRNNNSNEINIFKNSKDILDLFFNIYYFEGENFNNNFNIYESYNSFDLNNLQLNKLSSFKKLNSPLIFNKYVLQNNSNFLHLQFLSNVTYKILFMNNSYFSNFSNIELKDEEFITKKNNEEIIKICGNEYYVVEFKNNILSFFTSNRSDSDNSDGSLFFENPRRISFISLPKNFKFTKIYDYYFDKFNDKLILMLLIDNGVIISLDFSGSIFNKNVGGTFYKDNFDFGKTTLLFINCFFIFLYFLDWSIVDRISMDIKNFVVENFNFLNRYFWRINFENNNRRDNNWLNLSSSNQSIISINSNDESYNDDDNISHNENSNSNNNISINLNHSRNHTERNIFEDVFENMPYL